jgi:hypothetical protein
MKDYLSQPLAKRLAFHKSKPGARAYPAAYGYLDTNEGTGIVRDVDGTAHTSNMGELSLRFVGAADTVIRLDHNGWYVDHSQGETTRGVVYRLPSGRGFLAGYSDPWNGAKDGSGPCSLAFEVFAEPEDAAREADRLAECAGERYREDALQQEAASRLETAEEDAETTREEIRDILAGIRESTLAPSVCAVLRAKVRELRGEYLAGIRKAREYVANPYLLER